MKRRAPSTTWSLWLPLVMAMAAPVSAHHSAAGYDMSKTLTAQATIKEFRWGAPHCYAAFVVKGADGKSQDLTVESDTPTMFHKQGFKPRDFRVGDKVEISWHPAKSGALGGHLAAMKLRDGRTFKDVFFESVPGGPPGGQAGSASPEPQAP